MKSIHELSELQERLEFDNRSRSRRGTRIHRIICETWIRCPDGDVDFDSVVAVTKNCLTSGIPSARTRFETTNSTMAWRYFCLFVPPAATLVGAEAPVGSNRADVVLRIDGSIVIQEIKTCRSAPLSTRRDRIQAVALVTAGQQEFGASFAGLHIAWLGGRPSRSPFITPADVGL